MREPIGLIYYYGFEKSEDAWRKEIRRFSASNIKYLVIMNFYWQTFLKNETYKERTRRFLEICSEYDAKCLLTFVKNYTEYGFPGKNFGVFAESETRDIIKAASKVSEQLKNHDGLFGYYIDDEPPGRWDIKPESWRRWRRDFEETYNITFPENLSETTERQKVSYMKWLISKYIDYVERFKKAIKKVNPKLMISICFNPGSYRRGFIKAAEKVDFILVDLYPGWIGDPIVYRRSPAFYVKLNKDLLKRDFVYIAQCHRIILGHEPKLEEIIKWSQEALLEGARGLGWFAADFYGSEKFFRPTYYNSVERWKVVEKMSQEMKLSLPELGDIAVIIPLENSYHGVLDLHYGCHLYSLLRNIDVPFTFISDHEASSTTLRDYKIVLLAGQKYSPFSLLKALEDYVWYGGKLIASTADLIYDEDGNPLTSFLERVFGIKEIEDAKGCSFINLMGNIGGLTEKDPLPVSRECKLLSVKEKVTILGRERLSRKPIIISSKLGMGEAYYIGTNIVEASQHTSVGWKWKSLLKGIIDRAQYS